MYRPWQNVLSKLAAFFWLFKSTSIASEIATNKLSKADREVLLRGPLEIY